MMGLDGRAAKINLRPSDLYERNERAQAYLDGIQARNEDKRESVSYAVLLVSFFLVVSTFIRFVL